MNIKHIVLTAAFSAIVVPAFAQTATPRITERQENQQQRIANGVASGQLTAKESQHLEGREAKLAADKHAAKADGVVTGKERRQLKREENRDSRAIAAKKHNTKVQ